jgi:hypothetical protein
MKAKRAGRNRSSVPVVIEEDEIGLNSRMASLV